VELFFDLVYVFAVTQLSRYLLDHRTIAGALQTGLLLVMVWLLWVYTTWVTNWLDPEQIAVRLLLLGLVLVSLVMSAALPEAFGPRGLVVGCAYAVTQIGRSTFTVIALRGRPLQRNFQRILSWCLVSGALAIIGGIEAGQARELLWVGAVGVDLLGGAAGFYTPGWAARRLRSGQLRAAISPSGARRSSSLPSASPSWSSAPRWPARPSSAPQTQPRSSPPSSAPSACGGCTLTEVPPGARASSPARPILAGSAAPPTISSTR
jgi:hypothetical protein